MAPRIAERIIAVGGGKGGVGKSVVAANLSVALAQQGRRVVLVDGDLGAANQHTLFGIERPGPTLHALFTRQIETLDEALVPTGVENLLLLPGSGAVIGAANINHAQKQKLCRQIRGLDAEVIVLDVGAGVAFNTLDLFELSDLRVLVTTPQLTAIQNAYAFLKAALYRSLRDAAEGPAQLSLLEGGADAPETERMTHLLGRAGGADPAFRHRLEAALAGFRVFLVGNLVHLRAEPNVFHAVSRMIHDFLGLDAPVLGVLWNERSVHDSVNARAPFLRHAAGSEAAKTLRKMAAALLEVPLGPPSEVPAPREPEPEQAAEDLARSLAARERRHQRFQAGWPATLLGAGATFPVLVREISAAGALLDSTQPLAVDSGWDLLFDELEGAPSVPVVIRTSRNEGRRAGAQFAVDELPPAVAAALGRLQAQP